MSMNGELIGRGPAGATTGRRLSRARPLFACLLVVALLALPQLSQAQETVCARLSPRCGHA